MLASYFKATFFSTNKGLSVWFALSIDALYSGDKTLPDLCVLKESTKKPDFTRLNPLESQTSLLTASDSNKDNAV